MFFSFLLSFLLLFQITLFFFLFPTYWKYAIVLMIVIVFVLHVCVMSIIIEKKY